MMINEQEHPIELLPWFVNGTLSSEEQIDVDKHVANCDQCKAEISLLQRLEKQIKNDVPVNTPGQLGYKRLTRQIKQESKKQKLASPTSKWWQPAMAAAILVIVVQTSILLQTPVVDDVFVPLGAIENTIQVQFSPDATEAQIRKALNAIQGRIVDGPGALGVYRIALDFEKDQSQYEQIKKSAESLAKHPWIVDVITP